MIIATGLDVLTARFVAKVITEHWGVRATAGVFEYDLWHVSMPDHIAEHKPTDEMAIYALGVADAYRRVMRPTKTFTLPETYTRKRKK